MLTRCPGCETSFRVTPEQLKARAGKVRCGKCSLVFNALDSLVETGEATTSTAAPDASPPSPAPSAPAVPAPAEKPAPPPIPPKADIDILLEPVGSAPAAPVEPTLKDAAPEPEDAPAAPSSPEAVRDLGVAAGLVAARETTEIPGYNKWAEGAFTAPVSVSTPTERPRWPFVLFSLLLLLAFAGQAIHHFRSELVIAMPKLRPMIMAACEHLDCDIPLPRNRALVTIEASNLQIDPTQGGALMLTATLMNRAPYAQAWPLFELTLTDTQDNAILRRALQPAEYLPAKADPTLFPPGSEVDVRLWLDAKDVAAAGYRVEILYP